MYANTKEAMLVVVVEKRKKKILKKILLQWLTMKEYKEENM